jgi:4-amino-4-deoxy-L-arabinose transferase-like glycosyltransferase
MEWPSLSATAGASGPDLQTETAAESLGPLADLSAPDTAPLPEAAVQGDWDGPAPASGQVPLQRAGGHRPGGRWRGDMWWPLVAVLIVQAGLSLRLVWSNTAFEDEALYLWAGHLEWAHWLHGTPTPDFPLYFSGAPVIYPPLGALADSIGGLAGARVLSLCFMLGATVLLWATASRLYGKHTAFLAAGLWAILGPTQRLGAFATYDAMALFLVALAAWCVTGGRHQRGATRWMLAGAGALALANATKYASALFDPTVAGLAFLCGFPPGGKIALRRGGYLLALVVIADITLLLVARGHYIVGVDQTTLTRPQVGTRVSVVLRSTWDWTGAVVVLALLAVAVSLKVEKYARSRWLLALLAVTALLVPAEQARIHTYTSLDKHVDFGAWFAAIAAGYVVDRMARALRSQSVQLAIVATAALLVLVTIIGAVQSAQFFSWPGAANVMTAARELTSHGGRFLADDDPLFEYYLPRTSWRQWSSVYSITLPSGWREATSGTPGPYIALIAEHYFKVIVLAFTDRPKLDVAIAHYLSTDHDYRFVGTFPYSNPGVTGGFQIWVYRGTRGMAA